MGTYLLVRATWRAAVPRSRRFADVNNVPRLRRSVALQRIGQQSPSGAVTTMIGGDLEGCDPSQPPLYEILIVFRGADGADALQGIGQCRPNPNLAIDWRAAVPRSRRLPPHF